MEAENEEASGERGSNETASSSRENQPSSARLPDLRPEKDPMGAGGKNQPTNRIGR